MNNEKIASFFDNNQQRMTSYNDKKRKKSGEISPNEPLFSPHL
jgi:hypothetical protein